MQPVTSETFGLLIAYLIPGLIVLWGLSRFLPELAFWIGTSDGECQTFGGFLNLTVASVGTGLTASTVRWLVIDPIHFWTGVPRPAWNMADFHSRTVGLQVLVESYYRYYQAYANSLVALLFAAACYWMTAPFSWSSLFIVVGLAGLFFAGSRNTLSKYCRQVDGLLNCA